jgi:hypothetical protein
MDISKLKQCANPYYTLTANIDRNEFIGREYYLDSFRKELINYEKTSKIRNVIISGHKSVGKSTLLKRFKDILQDHSFAIYEVELIRDSNVILDEFEFIKEFLDDLFSRFGTPEGEFFDPEQSEIWYSLTSGQFNHPSDFKERQLTFATKYSNKKRFLNEKLNYKQIESDFRAILDEILSPKMEFKGLAIIIDEFQELSSNIFLLDTLRKLSENLVGLMIIGAGIPSFLNNSNFEKFIRSGLPMTLKNMGKQEALDLIFNPIQLRMGCTRYDVEKIFDHDTIREILARTQGNPLHIKILCANLFDEFQSNISAEKMKLNRQVMDKVMEYYSNISDKSRHIKNSLETCSKEQLQIFSKVYFYEGFNFKASILNELAFNSIQQGEVNRIKKQKLDDLNQIFDLGLFEFTDPRIDIQSLENYTINELTQVIYRFIGDAIDKMYASYLYEDLTHDELITPENKDFDELLVLKLSDEIESSIRKEKIFDGVDIGPKLTKLQRENIDHYSESNKIIDEFEQLKKIDPEKELNDESRQLVVKLSRNLDLIFPATLLSMLELEGLLLLVSNVSIKGKKTILYNYFPIEGNIADLIEAKGRILNYKDVLHASLDEYFVQINWMCLYWIPKRPLLLVYFVEMGSVGKKLFSLVKERKFEEAIKTAEAKLNLTLRIKKDAVFTNVEDYNNFAFCLINVSDYEQAEKIFLELEDKYLLSQINLSFIYFNNDNLLECKRRLKSILKKKLGESESASFLHLMFKHKDLSNQAKIAENILVSNVVLWNMALISSYEGEDISVINSFLKKIRNRKSDDLYDSRVRYWIDYYSGKKEFALEKAKQLIKKCSAQSFIYSDIQRDIEIFTNKL